MNERIRIGLFPSLLWLGAAVACAAGNSAGSSTGRSTGSSAGAAQEPQQSPSPQQPSPQRAALHAAGVAAPLRIYPIGLLGHPDANVADALGLVLEKHGMPDLQVAKAPCDPFDPADAAWDALPAKFAVHVQQQHAEGEARWNLFAQFLGDPRQGPTEVRFVVTNAKGELAIVDRQLPQDPTFRRTAGRDPDPLGCCQLVAERLFELAEWPAVPGGIEDGPFAALWRQKSGAPDDATVAAMQTRKAKLIAALPDVSLAVWPTLGTDGKDTAAFAAQLATALGGKVVAADRAALTVARSSNQQRRLNDLAAALAAAVRQQPIAADYAVAADVGIDAARGRGYTNVAIVDRQGELVLTDFQNDQHPAFQRMAPKTAADCEALVVERLRALLR